MVRSPMGPVRPAKYIVGDNPCVTLTVSGLAKDSNGAVEYFVKPELLDKDGEVVAQLEGHRISFDLFFGGNEATHFFTIPALPGVIEGEYACRVRLLDQTGGKQVVAEIPFTMLPKQTFGATWIYLSHDPQGMAPATGVLSVGQTAYLCFGINGYASAVDGPELVTKITALRPDGSHVDSRPIFIRGSAKSKYAQAGPIKSQIYFPLHESGKFAVRLEIEDKIAKKKVAYDIPIEVVQGTTQLSAELEAAQDADR